MKRHSSVIVASIALAAMSPFQTGAAVNTWNNHSGNFNWDLSSANWTAPTIWTDGNSAIFGPSGAGTVTLGAPIIVQNQTFNAPGYTITGTGNPLTMAGTTPTITMNAASTNATSLSGTNGLTIQGTGSLTLRGDTVASDGNHYTGGTYVKGGTLILGVADASGSGSAYGVDSIEALDTGATVRLESTFDGTSWAGPAQGQIGASNIGSRLHLTGGTFDMYNDPKNQLIPVPEGSGLIINSGPDVQAGVEMIADGLDHTFSGVIADGNGGVLIGDNSGQGPGYQIGIVTFAGQKNGGGGTWTLSGKNTYSGSTRIDQGATIKLAGAGTLGIPTPNGLTGPLRIYGPGGLDLNGTSQTIALMTHGNASGLIYNSAVGTVSTLSFGAGNEPVTSRDANMQYIDNLGSGGILALRKIGTNCIQTLSGVNTYSGDTTVSEGILAFSAASAVSSNSAFHLSTDATLSLTYSGTANVRQLWINAVQQPNGVYGASTPGIDRASTGTLTVTGYAPTLRVSQTGNSLTFSWEGLYKLQAKSNNIIGPWSDYPGGGTSPVISSIDKAKNSTFFQLSTK